MANDVYKLIVRGNCAGEFWETVQHYQTAVASASDPVATSDRLITGWINAVQDAFADLLAEDNFINGYSAKRVNNGGSPTVMRPITPVQGTVTGTSASSALAYLIVQEYSFSGKFRTGRWFIPGIPEAYLVGNGYTAPAVAAAAGVIGSNSGFIQSPDTFSWGVWSRTHSTFFLPIYAHLSAKIGVQRRRLLPV